MAILELEARLNNLLSTAQAETKNIDIFAAMPEREECPICMIPFPFEDNQSAFSPCCGKVICMGCTHKSFFIEAMNGDDESKCAFCRQTSSENYIKGLKKAMKNNNPHAFVQMGSNYQLGTDVLQSDTRSLQMRIRAAELGVSNAYAVIGMHYEDGLGIEQDLSKALAFYEVAAKKGSTRAHIDLAEYHGGNGDIQRSIEHLKVAANAGCQEAW